MNKLVSIFIFFSFININSLNAQSFFKKKKNKQENQKENKSESKNSIKTKIKDCVKYEGLFNLYQAKKDGKSFLEIKDSQLDGEFIYFSYTN